MDRHHARSDAGRFSWDGERRMSTSRRVILAGLAAVLAFACSDAPSSPTGTHGAILPEPIVSEARASGSVGGASDAGSLSGVTYVSLPPGSLPGTVSVRIRNLTAGGEAVGPILLVSSTSR